MEIRSLPISMDSDNSDGKLTVSGLVNGAGSVSEILQNPSNGRKFRETIAPGVFSDAIANSERIDFLSQHDKSLILSTTDNGSLGLKETSAGLEMSATISETTWGKDTFQLIKDGIIRGMSFGMRVLKDTWTVADDNIPMRTINAIELFEVSAVRNPAYKSSDIEARDIDVVNDVDVPDLEERDSKLTEEVKEEIRDVTADVKDVAEKPVDTAKEAAHDKALSDKEEALDRDGEGGVKPHTGNDQKRDDGEDVPDDTEPRDDEVAADDGGSADSEPRDMNEDVAEGSEGQVDEQEEQDEDNAQQSEVAQLRKEIELLKSTINASVSNLRSVYDSKITELEKRFNEKETEAEVREQAVKKESVELRDFFLGR